jgi:beta-glucanase (GH16 family)
MLHKTYLAVDCITLIFYSKHDRYMKHIRFSFSIAALAVLVVTASFSNHNDGFKNAREPQAETQFTTLLWSDEFNSDGAPDSTKWGYDLGASGWGNNESQHYTNRLSNAEVANGVLKITVKKEDYEGSKYTSARLLTKGKFAFTYGRVEMRAKLPTGGGTWPAGWMLGSDIDQVGWPACGEIDIMEHLGNDVNKIYGTLHYPGHSGDKANGANKMITGASTAFHVYAVDWSAKEIRITVDGNLVHTVPNSSAIPFNHNFFIILNVALGGNFGGAIDPAFNSSTMEVDYVRVYQQQKAEKTKAAN